MPRLIGRIAAAIRNFRRKAARGPPTPDPVKDAAAIRRSLRGRLSAHLLNDVGGDGE